MACSTRSSNILPIRAESDSLISVGGHINRAVVPAAAVLKVFDAIHGLEKSLSDPHSDLPGYLRVLKRLEEASKFLGDNCSMAIQWLTDIVEYLEDHKVADSRFTSVLKENLKKLRELENGEEKGRLDGWLLDVALERLENEFRRLLNENSVPLPMLSLAENEQPCIAPAPLPFAVIQKLQAILSRLIVNDSLEKCVSIYVEKYRWGLKKSVFFVLVFGTESFTKTEMVNEVVGVDCPLVVYRCHFIRKDLSPDVAPTISLIPEHSSWHLGNEFADYRVLRKDADEVNGAYD
ncbi:hypothetical protein CASFOL_040368 [Castilleja foliolosa]|uniref:Rx N-terminal domain-containing protein n=1 Tax=Castilleja foliolosa TaxID=1961234 RepID=A0ABD3BFN6_9LAMI